MMLRSLFGAVLLTSSVFAMEEGCEAMAMVQRINRNAGLKKQVSSPPLQQLLQAATKLLRTGAPYSVRNFTEEALEEIRKDILPKIKENHDLDQKMLNETLAMLEEIKLNYTTAMISLGKKTKEELDAIEKHKECRVNDTVEISEKTRCLAANTSNAQREDWWNLLLSDEGAYKSRGKKIYEDFCGRKKEDGEDKVHVTWYSKVKEPGDVDPMAAALQTFRVDFEKNHMRKFNSDGQKYMYTIDNWTKSDENANATNNSHAERKEQCDALQVLMEKASCARAHHHVEAIEAFESLWLSYEISFNQSKNNIAVTENDRQQEYVTLSMIECLLDEIQRRNGTACNETTDEAGTVIYDCETKDVDLTNLTIIYDCAPDKPEHTDVGIYPAQDGYANYYNNFTGFCFKDVPKDVAPDWAPRTFPMPAVHNKDSCRMSCSGKGDGTQVSITSPCTCGAYVCGDGKMCNTTGASQNEACI